MSKLHIYRNAGKIADGDGTISPNARFEVSITSGMNDIQQGVVYKICQGQEPPVDLYTCTHTNKDAKKATFLRQPVNFESESIYINNVLAMQDCLAAVQKSVNIKIANKDFFDLKEGKYNLCFAKKLQGNEFNVIWQSSHRYLSMNKFSWTPQYQLFGTNTFNEGVVVSASTDIVNIELGQTSTLTEDGFLQPPVTGGEVTCFTLNNEYDNIHPGVNQLCTGLDGKQTSSAIYVAPRPSVRGKVELTPVEKVLVWFQQNIETGTMFSGSRSLSIEVDLTKTNLVNLLYEGQSWKIV